MIGAMLILLLLPLVVPSQTVPAPLLSRKAESPGDLVETAAFRDGYSIIWGHSNVNELEDGMSIQLVLDQHSGSGFKSKDVFHYGFFSASIKLPANYSAGVVTAFYTSNSEQFPQTHDELDFEFLGVIPGMPYILQTNVYSNGSVHSGREERIRLWFDPTKDFHRYSMLWNEHHIVFYVDNIPIRQLRKSSVKRDHYPSKPMSVYATIWDGSNWATSGGKFPVDYNQAPFVASFTDLKIKGARKLASDNSELVDAPLLSFGWEDLTKKQKRLLDRMRRKFVSYSYCADRKRYPKSLPECSTLKMLNSH